MREWRVKIYIIAYLCEQPRLSNDMWYKYKNINKKVKKVYVYY